MKRVLRWIAVVLFLVIGSAVALVANVLWFKPIQIDWFFDRVFIELALQEPELLSTLRILEPIGLDFHNNDLSDVSPERAIKLLDKARRDLDTLRRYDREGLEPGQQMSFDILEYYLAKNVAGEDFLFHNYPLNQLSGIQNELPDFMVNIHQVESERDAQNYLARLDKFRVKFQQALEGLELRQERGIIPPRFVIEKVLEEMRGFVGKPAEENILYTSFIDKLEASTLSEDIQESLRAECITRIEQSVYPAYETLITFMASQEAVATTDDGVWKLPDGDAYYAHALESQTTTSMTPDEIHQVGMEETKRIQGEMSAILVSEGLTEGSVGDRMQALAKDPRFLYTDDDAGREACLQGYRDIIAEVNEGINKVFDLRPAASVAVERVPEFREEGAPGAYYQMPSMDGSRPGTFYANLRDMSAVPKFGMRTLAYHEAIPGHHFQIAIQQEIDGPTFRSLPLFTAYVEGWALYAEQLAWEQGYEEDPYDNLGRLQAELFRAVRLVVDTGIHAKRWTREEAIDFMTSNTGMDRSEVTTEIERYIVDPGQACAYKVGMMKILQLRQRAQDALGDRFSLKEFHNEVLASGALPLEVLEAVIERYIQRKSEA